MAPIPSCYRVDSQDSGSSSSPSQIQSKSGTSEDETIDATAAESVKPRKKQQHHKVRSGCDTCKLRRVKCDEDKPSCKRCRSSGRKCLGYNPPKQWIFQGAVPSSTVEHVDEPWLTTTLNPSFGERSDERRSLDFWLCNTGPTLANYGPNFDFWCQLIPTRAWQSEVIRHLVVATSMIDEQLGVYRTATSSKVGPEVIWHYHAAIKRMAGAKNPEKSCLVLASLLAWVCETLLKNYSSANIHINAATRLLSELETSSTGLDQTTRDFMVQCRPMLGLSASYVKVVCENTVPPENSQTAAFTNINGHKVHEIPVLESLTQIRDLGFDMIYLYLSTTQTRYDAWMQRVNVKNWHMAMRVYCSRSKLESNLYKNCVQLLFNLGLSFLPESEAGHFSQHATPNPTNHAIIALERIMVENEKNKVGSDRALVEDTIQKALRLIAGHVHDDDIRRRAVLLLGKLAVKAQASEHAEGLSIRNLQRS